MATQVFTPSGGMNQDDSMITPTPNMAGRNAFELGDYKYALNARIGSSRSDNAGDVETIKGTVEVTSYFVRSGGNWISGIRPSGTEKVIGKYSNAEFRKLYYAVYNASSNHCIRMYDPSTNAVYELLRWSGLNFSATMFISIAMIDSFMALTDRTNSPRLIDVDTVSDLFNDIGSSNFREYHISFHKWAPIMPPILSAFYDGVSNNYKKFQYKNYQFSYRYIYKNRLKSRWSPESYAAQQFDAGGGNEITSIDVYIPGFTLDQPGVSIEYNYFNNDDIKFTSSVETIEIGYRESQQDIWRIYIRHDVQPSGNILPPWGFTGESDSTPIPIVDFFQLFDTVPFLAGCVEAIDNRFVFADCLDEKDTAPTVQVTDVGVSSFDISQTIDNWWNFGTNDASDMAAAYSGMSGSDAAILGLRVMINDATFKGRGVYKLGIQYLSETGWRSAVYTIDTWIYAIPEGTGIVDKVYALTFKFPVDFIPPEWAVSYQIMRTNCLNIDEFLFGAANEFIPLVDNSTITDDLKVPEDIRNRIRQHFEDARQVTGQDYGKYLTTLHNKPFYKSLASDVRETIVAASLAAASRLYISVSNWYNSSVSVVGPPVQNNPMNNLFYNYREGDRVRFLASTDSTPGSSDKVVYDVPILEFTGLGIVIEKPQGIAWIPDGGADCDPVDFVIEVYTPKIAGQPGITGSENDYLYYESGEWYPILYPGTAQRDFAKRDWTWTGNTSGVTCETYGEIKVFSKRPFSYGDCNGILKQYYYDRKPDTTVSTIQYTASMNPDPARAWDSWEKNIGRSSPAYTDLPVVKFKPTQVRFGGQIVEESFVNNINRFREEDQRIYPSEYGRIRSMVNTSNAQVESVGAILLAVGERETFSIYVNRTTLEDLSGRSQVALSDRILGSYNTLLGSHGTFNPESVSLHRGNVYFWDAIEGAWIRYGRDGLTEISSYKMRNWFRELGQLLINLYGTSENPRIISDFDPSNDELVTFINHSTLPLTFRDYATYKGSIFSEDYKLWKSCHSYDPDFFANLNSQLLSFRQGSVYRHEQSSTYSTFYGTKFDVMIEPVFNEIPKDMKSWQSFAITSTHGWSVDRFLSEYRGAKTKQQSSLTLTQFEEREDGYYAAIKNDVNTPVVSSPIINGNKMRSKAIRALMKLDPSVVILSLLHYVTSESIDSPKNP